MTRFDTNVSNFFLKKVNSLIKQITMIFDIEWVFNNSII